MASLSLLKKSDLSLLKDKAIELGCNVGYLEKDYYLVSVMKCLQEASIEEGKLLFTGGTALAKGYKLIKRFSEDCDFIFLSPVSSRSYLSRVKNLINSHLTNHGFIVEVAKARNNNANIEYQIAYPALSGDKTHLRPEVKLEIIHKKSLLTDYHQNSIQSFLSESKHQEPEIRNIECLSIEEISMGKLSSLIWRTLDQNKEHDPRLIRHLYDLSSLSHQLNNSEEFRELCLSIIEDDLIERIKPPLSVSVALERIIPELINNPLHKQHYLDYLQNFIYEPMLANLLSFESAAEHLKKIIESLQQHKRFIKA